MKKSHPVIPPKGEILEIRSGSEDVCQRVETTGLRSVIIVPPVKALQGRQHRTVLGREVEVEILRGRTRRPHENLKARQTGE